MKDSIKPILGSGFRDYLPEDMIPRQKILDLVRNVFERYGFSPLDTPGIEREEILTGGDKDFKKQIFKVGHQRGEEKFALRFDLTVPLARVIASNGGIVMPFKRYQSGKVWRGERPQAGRYREFIQFDADIVGTNSLLADAEIVSLIYTTLKELGFNKFTIKVNNRKILNALPEIVSFKKSQLSKVLRVLDKLDKIGWFGVSDELKSDLEFSEGQLVALKKFVELSHHDLANDQIISKLMEMKIDSKIFNEGVSELSRLSSYLKASEVSDSNWKIDVSIARGLGYYTGIVFETILDDLPSIGSVFSGGRYDNLVSRFGSQSFSAVGASVGVDRLFAAMEKLNLIERVATNTRILMLNTDVSLENKVLEILSTLRRNEISTEIYYGKEKMIGGQISYALKKGIPYVIIVGTRELENQSVQFKDLQASSQCEIKISDLVPHIQNLLK